jgi:hypothetical protein
MTERNLKQELCHFTYEDMENSENIETINYECLIGLLEELIDRVDGLESQVRDLQEIIIAQEYARNIGL